MPDASPAPIPASSSTEGFFQQRPHLANQFEEDAALRRCISFFLPADVQSRISPDLHAFGDTVLSPTTIRHMADAERNLPYVKQFDTFGRRVDTLVTSEGWRASTALSHREGLVAIGYDKTFGPYARVYQYLKTHLWTGSCCGVMCPSAMHDGAISLLLRHVTDTSPTPDATKQVLRAALDKLLSRDPERTWTSGQWMTERPGGSDVRNTETRATYTPDLPSSMPVCASDGSPLGPWSVSGFKFFSSATDAGMAVLLAKTGNTDKISAFFAPTKLLRTLDSSSAPLLETNGIQIQRLKNKLGTKPVPTAELVLSGTRAHLIGAVGQGTKEISSILTITRMHCAIYSLGCWGRGLAISRAYTKIRSASGKLLIDLPAHVKDLAAQHVSYRAHMLLMYFVVSLLGVVEAGDERRVHARTVPRPGEARHLLRIFTPVLKSISCLAAVDGLRWCMESLGGVGYLENEDPELNIAGLFRDCNVQPIWEGTTNVQGADVVRVFKGREGKEVLSAVKEWVDGFAKRYMGEVERSKREIRGASSPRVLAGHFDRLRSVVSDSSPEYLQYRSREIMEGFSWLACAVLLFEDAMRDDDAVAWEVASRWMTKPRGMFFADEKGGLNSSDIDTWTGASRWDRKISFGEDDHGTAARL